MKRRSFITGVGAGLSALSLPAAALPAVPSVLAALPTKPTADRDYWVTTLLRIVEPVLAAGAAGKLKTAMPVESAAGQQEGRRKVTHLEALGRTLAGLAPWLELADASAAEQVRQQRCAELARQAIAHAVNPQSPGFLNFSQGGQPVVDAAFLAHALLRAPSQLWTKLPAAAQQQLVQALQSSRVIKPVYSNWLLFSGIIEAALLKFTGSGDLMRMDYAIKEHQTWYKGDGTYGDGPDFHWDYYNSYVIQPMLLDVVGTLVTAGKENKELLERLQARARRYAVVQERLIAPDGSFAAFGRSLAYRCGAFQHLAQVSLQQLLPAELPAGQVRSALTAVIRRTLEPKGTFDAQGWLQIGLCGHQPGIGETYISTGSLYLCTTAFLPLGLPASDPYWTSPAQDWTARRIWSGQDVKTDHAL
ncbi:hypothetical protein AUC43_09460 [Hymenobacter sedentarius]|uniref:DUF2264 domain-containing protein n=1 Tax=Hymenobacter sedentarius TaxID=1411621 RepID=A0A0U4AP28_9BACT|nr:DUF2264 domain-containing protein [Hymenobacter sedentarius]ALW85301.1 hypothetical protein AUC43_09460 [Hymenobacter sedentarius]